MHSTACGNALVGLERTDGIAVKIMSRVSPQRPSRHMVGRGGQRWIDWLCGNSS